MDIDQMHLAFRLQLDKSGALELPAFEPEEIDFWLNTAIVRFVKTRFTGTDKNLSFEEHLKRTEDLKTLVVEETIVPADGTIKPNSYIADLDDLSEEKWFILGEEVDISRTILGASTPTIKRQGITQCTVDTYRSHIDDPYSEHILHYEEAKPLRLVYQNTIELITDGNYTIPFYYIRYLRKPTEVDVTTDTDCDLPEHTHDEIISIATSMVLENIEQPRYQSQLNELNKVE
jgi:hypothetical protein